MTEPKKKPCRWCGKTVKEEYHECDYSRGRRELYCKHGIGHSVDEGGIHGCDGCCSKEAWKKARDLYANKK